jgi:hypothetical protein
MSLSLNFSLPCLGRHARAWPGHPRFSSRYRTLSVDGPNKSGHDGFGGASLTSGQGTRSVSHA